MNNKETLIIPLLHYKNELAAKFDKNLYLINIYTYFKNNYINFKSHTKKITQRNWH